jgi:hypothetical protein
MYIVYLKVIDPQSVFWDDGRKASYFRFTAWADAGVPKDFQFLVGPEQPLMAQVLVSLNPEVTGPNQDFWQLLKSARTKFSYNTTAATFSFDTTDLQSALQRFEDRCAKIIPAPYNPSVQNPGSGFWFDRWLGRFGVRLAVLLVGHGRIEAAEVMPLLQTAG